jgi:hypothetical protein
MNLKGLKQNSLIIAMLNKEPRKVQLFDIYGLATLDVTFIFTNETIINFANVNGS